MIYTLLLISPSSRWETAIGIRTIIMEGVRPQERILARQSFGTRREADRWLFDHTKALKVPFLPKKVPLTRVPLCLGGVIPTD